MGLAGLGYDLGWILRLVDIYPQQLGIFFRCPTVGSKQNWIQHAPDLPFWVQQKPSKKMRGLGHCFTNVVWINANE